MRNIRAIIPVAGVGTRLRPHTYTIPKVLLNVAGKPIIAHILDKLVDEGIEKVTLIVGYLGELVEDFVRKSYQLDAEFIYQEERKGLGHAVYLASSSFKDDEILIVLGDTIFDLNLKKMLNNQYSCIGVKYVEDPRRFGVAEIKKGFISNLAEKPDKPLSHFAIVGIYYLKNNKLLFEGLQNIVDSNIISKGEYQLTDALSWMLNQGTKIEPFSVDGWYDCGTFDTLLSTNQFLLSKNGKHYEIEGNVIIQPTYISHNSKLENCIIGPYTTISDGVNAKNAIIQNSIIGDNATIENMILHDSLIGNNTCIYGKNKKLNTGDSTYIEFS